MKIKKLLMVLTMTVITMGISSCQTVEKPNSEQMYIEPAKLTEQEQNILNLLGTDNKDNLIADFKLDDNVKSMVVSQYRLEDGKWDPESKSSSMFTDNEGRFAISFERLSEGMRFALQSEKQKGSSTSHFTADDQMTDEQIALSKIGVGTTKLSNKTKIEYEKEIPLVLQVITSKNEIHLVLDSFDNPENYADKNYEAVYMITVKFSQQEIKNAG